MFLIRDNFLLMQQLLENEGIQIVDNQIVDFEKVFWEPEINPLQAK